MRYSLLIFFCGEMPLLSVSSAYYLQYERQRFINNQNLAGKNYKLIS